MAASLPQTNVAALRSRYGIPSTSSKKGSQSFASFYGQVGCLYIIVYNY